MKRNGQVCAGLVPLLFFLFSQQREKLRALVTLFLSVLMELPMDIMDTQQKNTLEKSLRLASAGWLGKLSGFGKA